jgi:hypothetical protein
VGREPYWKNAILRIGRVTCQNTDKFALSV